MRAKAWPCLMSAKKAAINSGQVAQALSARPCANVLAARRVEEGLELEEQRRGPQFVIRQVVRS